MKVIGTEKRKEYCGEILTGYSTIYILDKLPKNEEYIELGNKKGYVVSINYDEEDKCYDIYLEKNLGDWNNQISDICSVVRVVMK